MDSTPAPRIATPADSGTLIQSVQRAMRLLESVGESSRGLTAKQLARRTGIALPTTYHLLRTLVHEDYLVKSEGGYLLGARVLHLSQKGENPHSDNRLRPILEALNEATDAPVCFAVFRDGEIVLQQIVRSPTQHHVDLWSGVQSAGHATAFGKCLLATIDCEARLDYLARHELPRLTPHTLTDAHVFDGRLASPAGLIEDHEEYQLGTTCIAIPVVAPQFAGAIAIADHARHHQALHRRVSAVTKTAGEVARVMALG